MFHLFLGRLFLENHAIPASSRTPRLTPGLILSGPSSIPLLLHIALAEEAKLLAVAEAAGPALAPPREAQLRHVALQLPQRAAHATAHEMAAAGHKATGRHQELAAGSQVLGAFERKRDMQDNYIQSKNNRKRYTTTVLLCTYYISNR